MGKPVEHTAVAPLGFGCAQLFRLHSAREREAALRTAYDAGIRHFDVAPLYGLGLAEAELGRFLLGRRGDVTVATKFGLNPAAGASALRAVQGVARRLINAVPPVKQYLQRRHRPLAGNQVFDAKAANRSLEQSLRLLGVDYIDFFMLHEPTVKLVERDRPLDFLHLQRDRGRIRSFGVAGPLETVRPVLERHPTLGAVIQHPAPPLGCPGIEFGCPPPCTRLIYGSISGRIAAVRGRLDWLAGRHDAGMAQFAAQAGRWRKDLARLLLLEQQVGSPSSTVLFGSTDPAHIQELVRPPSSEEVEAITWLRNWAGVTAPQAS
jgi:D-threo-aldose 1-dehydrogenase